MTETKQFIDSLFDTAAQAIESFADGVQFTDIGDFVDEGLNWPNAVEGLKQGFPEEAKKADVETIEAMFDEQRAKLVNAGLNPLLVGSIISGLKGTYYTYAAIIQSKQPLIEKKS